MTRWSLAGLQLSLMIWRGEMRWRWIRLVAFLRYLPMWLRYRFRPDQPPYQSCGLHLLEDGSFFLNGFDSYMGGGGLASRHMLRLSADQAPTLLGPLLLMLLARTKLVGASDRDLEASKDVVKSFCGSLSWIGLGKRTPSLHMTRRGDAITIYATRRSRTRGDAVFLPDPAVVPAEADALYQAVLTQLALCR